MRLIGLVGFISGIQGLLIPFRGCPRVFFHAVSGVVAVPDGKYGDRESLVRRQLIEPEGRASGT